MFNPITTLNEEIECSSIVPSLEGNGTVTETFVSKGYRCEGRTQYGSPCRLVWTRAHQAIGCASRRHRNRYADTYYWSVSIEGRETLIEQTFIREALRRDGARPQASTSQPSAPTPEASPEAVPSLETVRAYALSYGMRLSRIPAPKVIDVREDPGYVSPLEPDELLPWEQV